MNYLKITNDFVGVLQENIKVFPKLIHTWRFGIGIMYALKGIREGFFEQSAVIDDNIESYKEQSLAVINNISQQNSVDLAWLDGFYFNAAIMRTAAFYERVLRSLLGKLENEQIDVVNKLGVRIGRKKVRQLNIYDLEALVIEKFFSNRRNNFSGCNANKVVQQVNKLKHDFKGVSPNNTIKHEVVVLALEEIVYLLTDPEIVKELQNYK